MQERHQLAPYLYNAQRELFDTGIALLRPMYYEYPELEMAYAGTPGGLFPQYFFGPDMIVSPIVSRAQSNDSLAVQTIWLPPAARWFDELFGECLVNETISRTYDLSETPRFVRVGSIIPRLPFDVGNTIGRLSRQYDAIECVLYMDEFSSSGFVSLYEDDASTVAYLGNGFTRTNISYSKSLDTIAIQVAPPVGSYSGHPSSRSYVFRYHGPPPASVAIQNRTIPFSEFGRKPNTWTYDGLSMSVVICTAIDVATSEMLSIAVTLHEDSTALEALLLENAFRGIMRRAVMAKRTLDPYNFTPGTHVASPAYLAQLASIPETLVVVANDFDSFVRTVKSALVLYTQAVKEIDDIWSFGATAEVVKALSLLHAEKRVAK
jgi:hypothetical protein